MRSSGGHAWTHSEEKNDIGQIKLQLFFFEIFDWLFAYILNSQVINLWSKAILKFHDTVFEEVLNTWIAPSKLAQARTTRNRDLKLLTLSVKCMINASYLLKILGYKWRRSWIAWDGAILIFMWNGILYVFILVHFLTLPLWVSRWCPVPTLGKVECFVVPLVFKTLEEWIGNDALQLKKWQKGLMQEC